jgi:hypothetical protein
VNMGGRLACWPRLAECVFGLLDHDGGFRKVGMISCAFLFGRMDESGWEKLAFSPQTRCKILRGQSG